MSARGRSERSRREIKRLEKPLVLIVCEGETELEYFKDIKQRFRASWIEVYKPHCNDPKGLLAAAVRRRRELVRKGLKVDAWVVFDAESRAEQNKRGYAEAIDAAGNKGICIANSSPSFEYWILLHYAPGILVNEPLDAERELRKAGRIPGYSKPKLPWDELWIKYRDGGPSAAAAKRRQLISDEGKDVRLGRPVTYVDTLVDGLVAINERGNAR